MGRFVQIEVKKRTAILLFGTLLCSIAGYVTWCFRPFYLRPHLESIGPVSPEGRRVAEKWLKTCDSIRPLEFEWTDAIENLCDPWSCDMAEPVYVLEAPGSGLWTLGDRIWGFSKIGGKWDATTAVDLGVPEVYPGGYNSPELIHQGVIASLIETFGANGTTMEIPFLGELTEAGHLANRKGTMPDPASNSTTELGGRTILGHAKVIDLPAREKLLEELARSVREASPYTAPAETPAPYRDFPAWHGIILTQGDRKLEFAICFESGCAYVFGEGVDGEQDKDRNEKGSFVCVSPRAGKAFYDFLRRQGVEQQIEAKPPEK